MHSSPILAPPPQASPSALLPFTPQTSWDNCHLQGIHPQHLALLKPYKTLSLMKDKQTALLCPTHPQKQEVQISNWKLYKPKHIQGLSSSPSRWKTTGLLKNTQTHKLVWKKCETSLTKAETTSTGHTSHQ